MEPDTTLEDLPEAMLIVECDECPRISRYKRSALIAQFGADAKLSHILTQLCPNPIGSAATTHRPQLVGILPRKSTR